MICGLMLPSILVQVIDCLLINHFFTVELKQGRQITCWEQVFTCCSAPSSPHPRLHAPDRRSSLTQRPVGPCSSSSVLCDVRDAWLPNIEMDHKCPYVSMACISRKTVTHLISHSQKLEAGPWWSFIKRNLLSAQADTGTDDGQGGILTGVIYVEAFKSLLNSFCAR